MKINRVTPWLIEASAAYLDATDDPRSGSAKMPGVATNGSTC